MNPTPLRSVSGRLAMLCVLALPVHSYAQDQYKQELSPLLQQYCGSCHGSARGGRGGVNFTTRGDDGAFIRDPRFWVRTIKVLEDRSMPENAARLNFTEVERQKIIQLIRQCMRNPESSKLAKDPGPAPLRLMTQYEYASVMRDLLGVTALPENKLPADTSFGDDLLAVNLGMSPYLLNRYMNVAEDILDALPRERVVPVEPSEKVTKRELAEKMLKEVQTRAFRRPIGDEDMTRVMGLFDEIEKLGKPFDETMRITLTGVFASPKFISHIEQPVRGEGPQKVEQYDLASRLSFFIWSSIPDDTLMQLAGQGKLSDPTVVEQQVQRMLADPKAKALAENFGIQWLGLRDLRPKTPPATQPASQPSIPLITQADINAMKAQAVKLLEPVFHGDKSVLSLLEDEHGGVLSLSAVQYATAANQRTSPPRRGKWVVQTLLGEWVSPGIYETCRITKDGPNPEGASLYTKLENARAQAACAVCHDRIDTAGMALERFDAIGRERPDMGDIPALQKSLLTRKDQFARNLVERMLGFALGRPIEPCDQATVQEIAETLAKNNYRSSVLVHEIAKSFPFNYRRPPED